MNRKEKETFTLAKPSKLKGAEVNERLSGNCSSDVAMAGTWKQSCHEREEGLGIVEF